MGTFDNALKNSVPGGNLATPIAIAAGALILGKLLSGRSPAPTPAPAPAAPSTAPDVSAPSGGLLGGLNDLIQKLQNGGHGETVDSWIGHGENAPIQPGQLGSALGQQTIGDLMRQSGLNQDELLAQLAKVLPNIVNNLTPNGRLPTQNELGE